MDQRLASDTYVVLAQLPIDAYRDEPVREFYWAEMRKRAAIGAAQDRPGSVLDENDNGSRMTQWARYVETGEMVELDDGEQVPGMILIPCSEEQAEWVYMRLVVRTIGPAEETSPEG